MKGKLNPLRLNELLCRPSLERAARIFFLTSRRVNATASVLAERHNARINRAGSIVEQHPS
jgi:hypothetical protein